MLFQEGVQKEGVPDKIRADDGVENVEASHLLYTHMKFVNKKLSPLFVGTMLLLFYMYFIYYLCTEQICK